jgi:hypothetical protein
LWLRWLLSLLLVLGIAALSKVPYGQPPEHGVLRLSWKSTGEKIRVATAAQGEEVPAHMRAADDFDEKMRDYQLTVEVDGKVWLDKLMRPPGLHHDRPISVFEELPLPPGQHQLHLKFWPVPADGATWKPEIQRTVQINAGFIETITLSEETPAL